MNIKNVSLTSSLSPRFAVTVLFRRKLLTLRQLSHEQNICFYFADASARTSSDTTSTWCVCGTQKVRGTFWGLTAFYQQAHALNVRWKYTLYLPTIIMVVYDFWVDRLNRFVGTNHSTVTSLLLKFEKIATCLFQSIKFIKFMTTYFFGITID